MKEGRLDVKAHYFIVGGVCECEEDANAREFDDWCVCLTIVLGSLAETLGNETGLLFSDDYGSIWVIFVVVCPAYAYCFSAVW